MSQHPVPSQHPTGQTPPLPSPLPTPKVPATNVNIHPTPLPADPLIHGDPINWSSGFLGPATPPPAPLVKQFALLYEFPQGAGQLQAVGVKVSAGGHDTIAGVIYENNGGPWISNAAVPFDQLWIENDRVAVKATCLSSLGPATFVLDAHIVPGGPNGAAVCSWYVYVAGKLAPELCSNGLMQLDGSPGHSLRIG